MKIRPSSYFLIVILLFALTLGILSFTYPDLKTGLIPAIISIIVVILSVVQLRKELFKARQIAGETGSGEKVSATEASGEFRKYLLVLGWVAGFIFAVYIVGFLVSIPLFMFLYLKLHGQKWRISIIMPIIAIAFVYLIFVVLLKLVLFPGIVFGGVF